MQSLGEDLLESKLVQYICCQWFINFVLNIKVWNDIQIIWIAWKYKSIIQRFTSTDTVLLCLTDIAVCAQ